MARLEHFQLTVARVILGKPLFLHTNHSRLLSTLHLPTLTSRRMFHLSILAFNIKKRTIPKHLLDISFRPRIQPYNLRLAQTFNTPIPRTTLYLQSPLLKSSTVSDMLPLVIQNASSLTQFKTEASSLLPLVIQNASSLTQFKSDASSLSLLSSSCSCSSYPYPLTKNTTNYLKYRILYSDHLSSHPITENFPSS